MFTSGALERALNDCNLQPAAAIVRRLDAEGEVRAGDPDMDVYPASMLKTPLCAAALVLVHEGVLALDGVHTVTEANMTANDLPSPLVPGYASALTELVELAITRSDNVATNMLYDIAGRERATQICRERFGLGATRFCRKLSGDYPLISDPQWDGTAMNRHSARDAAAMFELIARTRVPFARLLRRFLAEQRWNNKLSLGLQAGDSFDHKTGDTDEVTHDGGILETSTGASYVVVVYTGLQSSDEHNARFGPFMERARCLM